MIDDFFDSLGKECGRIWLEAILAIVSHRNVNEVGRHDILTSRVGVMSYGDTKRSLAFFDINQPDIRFSSNDDL